MFSLTPLHPLANYRKVSLASRGSRQGGEAESSTGGRDVVKSGRRELEPLIDLATGGRTYG